MKPPPCPICGCVRWRRSPQNNSILVCRDEGHVLQNYVRETHELDVGGASNQYTLHKRSLKKGKKKSLKKIEREWKKSLKDHGYRAGYLHFLLLTRILHLQVQVLTSLLSLPLEFEIVTKELWSLYLSSLSEDILKATPLEVKDLDQVEGENEDDEGEDLKLSEFDLKMKMELEETSSSSSSSSSSSISEHSEDSSDHSHDLKNNDHPPSTPPPPRYTPFPLRQQKLDHRHQRVRRKTNNTIYTLHPKLHFTLCIIYISFQILKISIPKPGGINFFCLLAKRKILPFLNLFSSSDRSETSDGGFYLEKENVLRHVSKSVWNGLDVRKVIQPHSTGKIEGLSSWIYRFVKSFESRGISIPRLNVEILICDWIEILGLSPLYYRATKRLIKDWQDSVSWSFNPSSSLMNSRSVVEESDGESGRSPSRNTSRSRSRSRSRSQSQTTRKRLESQRSSRSTSRRSNDGKEFSREIGARPELICMASLIVIVKMSIDFQPKKGQESQKVDDWLKSLWEGGDDEVKDLDDSIPVETLIFKDFKVPSKLLINPPSLNSSYQIYDYDPLGLLPPRYHVFLSKAASIVGVKPEGLETMVREIERRVALREGGEEEERKREKKREYNMRYAARSKSRSRSRRGSTVGRNDLC